jgi:hypothetical protein
MGLCAEVMMIKDPFDELIVDENKELDKELLAEILRGRVQVTTSGKIIFANDFEKYPNWKRIMLFLLAKKVVFAKKLNKEPSEAATLKEIENVTLVSSNDVSKRIARELKGIAEKKEKGYTIPNYKLIKCKQMITKEKK